jgi:hypothetical protein
MGPEQRYELILSLIRRIKSRPLRNYQYPLKAGRLALRLIDDILFRLELGEDPGLSDVLHYAPLGGMTAERVAALAPTYRDVADLMLHTAALFIEVSALMEEAANSTHGMKKIKRSWYADDPDESGEHPGVYRRRKKSKDSDSLPPV